MKIESKEKQQDFMNISFSAVHEEDVELRNRTIAYCQKNGINRSAWLKLLIKKELSKVEHRT